MTDLTCVAVYERSVHASLERVWENVHDWEHLPWLHAGSFASIELVEQGAWGWKARIGADQGEILLELVRDEGRDRYVSRTLEGRGAGTEIWTSLVPVSEERTDIRVEFHVPSAPPPPESVGRSFTKLYTRLWDEDEAMMRRRSERLAAKREPGAEAVDLGTETEVRQRAPFSTRFDGRRFRVVLLGGELLAHAADCPHWQGPLDEGAIDDGCVTCPWHGYRFDVRSGARRDNREPDAPAPGTAGGGGGRAGAARAARPVARPLRTKRRCGFAARQGGSSRAVRRF